MRWMLALLLVGTSVGTNGFATMWLWQWFLVPLGLPTIGLLHASGIVLLASFLSDHTRVGQVLAEEDWHTLLNVLWYMLPSPVIALVTGFVVHLLMVG